MSVLRMVILAKSYKPGGRCIAGKIAEYSDGKNVKLGKWVRPVPNTENCHDSLAEEMYQFEDGTDTKILDIVDIPVLDYCSVPGQPENIKIDQSQPWKKVGHLNPRSITKIADSPVQIWLEDEKSTNIVSSEYDEQGLITQSLYLIQPTNLLLTLSNNYNEYEEKYKRVIVASFDYAGIRYEGLSVTCPSIRKALTNKYPDEGEEETIMPLIKGDNYVICVSLAPRFGRDDVHYKVVATIFDYDGYLQREYAV